MQKYGLIGANVTYSYSKIIHEYIAKIKEIELEYELLSISDLTNFDLTKYDGLNVTIPYKNEIIKYLNEVDSYVQDIQSCNTITKTGHGYNTDVKGFVYGLERLIGSFDQIKRVVILGNSNSAKMIKSVFLHADVKICSRTPKNGMISYDEVDEFYGDLIINTTPVTMVSKNESPIVKKLLKNFKYGYDLNYNPSHNQFLCDLTELEIPNDNGLIMLIMQAVYAFEIWHNLKLNTNEIEQVIDYIEKIVWPKMAIIGMPYSGKTTLGQKYEKVGKVVIDLDAEITKKYGSIEQIMINFGVDGFREIETKVLKDVVLKDYDVLVLGGGIVEENANYKLLNNHRIKWLNPSLDVLIKQMQKSLNANEIIRPLTQNVASLTQKENMRKAKYKIWSKNQQI